MQRYKIILALCGFALASMQSMAANTSAFEKAVDHSDTTTASTGTMMPMHGDVPSWLAGAWVLVRCDNVYPDGHVVELYGPKPQGLWLIDAQGHYMMQIVRAERGHFAANDKSKGTPDEYRAASLDSNAHYGWVSVEGTQMHTHIAHASFPNWDGKDGSTSYTIDGDQLTYVVAKPSSGASDGAKGVVVWRRVSS
ncbi:lipocalin-like domain-containing protein [Dyella sp. 20L07]|uniref:lipocalin-like domain-containing protein n=1 Tax=Dyella sp. 20L07 TaxID=3384240 RepID=UPI003D28CD29